MSLNSPPGSAPGVHRLAGLEAPVEITVDRRGIAHIRAGSQADLFFAQGYNAARDRLWQIDLWRKRGLGLLAADFGPGFLEQDRATRLFLYRGDMAAEWAAYGPESEAICTAFAAGINARIAEIEAGGAPLPEEFALLGNRPARWTAADVVRIRSHCLTRNALSEVLRAHIIARAGKKADALRRQILPAVEPFADAGLDLASIPLSVLETFALATAPVSFPPERLQAGLEEAGLWRVLNPLGDVVRAADSEGSNNWVVSAGRSETGRPIMACDPHRAHAVPSLRYLVHLTMPGFDAIGMGEPAVPGISLGHNGHIAYSLTIFGGDQEDVYVYETDPGDPARYRYGDGWERMTETVERFEVRGHPAQEHVLRFTRHGPVLVEERAAGRAYGLRTAWTDPGMAPYMASLRVMKARTHAEYVEALAFWGTPSVNHLYADTSGTIAWHPSGATPVRPNWNGLLPVPGDGRYEWQGYVAQSGMPQAVNPERGFIATANEMNLPAGWAETGAPIGYEWIDKSRSERLHAVLGAQERHGLADACRLQNDLHSEVAVRIVKVLAGLPLREGDAARAAALLSGWDGWLGIDSAPGALFELWLTRHLKPALGRHFGADRRLHGLMLPYDNQSVTDVLERPGAWFDGPDADAVLAGIVAATLAAAWREAAATLGEESGQWRWGDLHGLTLTHPLARLFPEAAERLSLPRMPLGGGGSSPNYAPYRAGDFETVTGPSIRLVMDVGNWDDSLFVGLPGQSGDPGSPHYRDLAADWHGGRYHPLPYSAEAVAAAAESVIRLEPAG